MAAHTNTTRPSMMSDMLDLSFVTEWSDDEGIGSDVSLENSEQSSSSSGTLNNTDTLRRQARQLVNIPKRNISVKKFVKILRRSVGTGNSETVSTEVGPVSGAESQFQSQRVFGVDLTEHLEQTSCLVPRIVEFCCEIIQELGLTDGVYRLSGQSSHIVNLKREFEGGKVPELESRSRDVHAVASLLKLYFRSLPEPLLTFSLYQDFIQAAKFSLRYQVSCLRKLVSRLPRAHRSTLTHVMRHLHGLAAQHKVTGMTSRNLAIVWAPNLLRPNNQDCLRDCGLQALVVEALIVYFEEIFEPDQAEQGGGCVTKKNFTKEVSIDQAVARAESFKPKTPERRMVRSISCVSTLKTPGPEAPDIDRRLQGSRFQSRGVHLKRDRSLNCENTTRHRQLPASPAPASAPVPDARQTGLEKYTEKYQKIPDYSGSQRSAPAVARLGPRTRSEIFPPRRVTEAEEDEEEEEEDISGDVSRATETERLRSSRAKLKERLNWFSSRSRQRLSSFGSSDNLKYVREGFLRSRDKLSSTLSPIRGARGSYQFVDTEMKNFPSQGSICVRVGTWQ